MRIMDGNIFEGMRLVLPEHRQLMERSKQESKKRKPPILSEDEWSEMGYILAEALQHKHKIRITLFDPYEPIVYEGIPMWANNQLSLQTVEGTQPINLLRIVKVEDM